MSRLRRLVQSGMSIADTVLPRLPGPRILIYHQVGSGRSHEMNVAAEVFRRQLDWLVAHQQIVRLSEAIERRVEPGADRLVVLTFDDGYADVYEHAFPLMRERDVPFTMYLTTGPMEDAAAFPNWPGKHVSWGQVAEMLDSGLMTLGAHTHTHPDLRHVDERLAIQEVERSNHIIRQRLGADPRHFTYPKGWWSAIADPIVRRTYSSATVGMGSAVTAGADLHALGRVSVMQSDPFWAFRRKLTTGGRVEALARRVRHGYRGP